MGRRVTVFSLSAHFVFKTQQASAGALHCVTQRTERET